MTMKDQAAQATNMFPQTQSANHLPLAALPALPNLLWHIWDQDEADLRAEDKECYKHNVVFNGISGSRAGTEE